MHIIFKKDFNFTENVLASSKILVVDDVLTTGFTMGTLIHHLKRLGAHRIEGLVVAARAPV